MAAAPHEIELKFQVAPEQLEAVRALAGDTPATTLASTYFDTPSRALRSAGMALRVRHDGRGWIQTLKARPSNGEIGRPEWEWPVGAASPDLRALRRTPAAEVLSKAERLEPLFTVTVERRTWIEHEDETLIECALDVGQVAADGRTEGLCELEFELKAGDVAALLAHAARTRRRLGLVPSFTTKADRGFELAGKARLRAWRFEAPPLVPTMTSGDAFRAVARASLEQIAVNAERLREAPGPEVIHQMRVGLRRLRSAFSTFKAIATDARTRDIKAELGWLTAELDPARNLDVLLLGAYRRAARSKSDLRGLKDLGRRLRLQREAAYARARSAAASERFAALLMEVHAWLEVGVWTSAGAATAAARDVPVRQFAARALERRRAKVVKSRPRLESMTQAERHALRIQAKKLRYAADAFAGLWGRPSRARRFIASLKVMQDSLGELNDIATGAGLAMDVARTASHDGDAVWAAGRMVGAETAREAGLLASAAEAHAQLRAAGRFWPKT